MSAFGVEIYKVIVFNSKNKVKRHDTQYLSLEQLPGGFSRKKRASVAEMSAIFSKWIKVQWIPGSDPRLIARVAV
jgi:hypothetical protein